MWCLRGVLQRLAHLFPAADVPVVQLAIDRNRGPAFHYETGRRLAPLRDDDVLIVASGNVVHHLGMIRWQHDAPPYPWAVEFDDHVRACALRHEHAPLVDFASFGAAARHAVPTPEHYLPLLYILGTQAPGEPASVITDGIELGSISMLSLAIGHAAAPTGETE